MRCNNFNDAGCNMSQSCFSMFAVIVVEATPAQINIIIICWILSNNYKLLLLVHLCDDILIISLPSSPPASSLITQTHFLWPHVLSICRKKNIAPLHLSSSMESVLTQTCFQPHSHLKISTASHFDFQFPSCPMLLQTSTSLLLRLRQLYPLHHHLRSSLTHHESLFCFVSLDLHLSPQHRPPPPQPPWQLERDLFKTNWLNHMTSICTLMALLESV